MQESLIVRVGFIEDPKIAQNRLEKIKLAISDLVAEKHKPLMAYAVLLGAAINHLTHGLNKMFYFPIPWDIGLGWPSHPSLVADARSYCRSIASDPIGLIVDSFAEWRLFQSQEKLCCCGKGYFFLKRERIVPIEIVIHHPVNIDQGSRTIEIKQLIGIRSNDRDHIENHYDLRRDSRVNSDISIIGTSSVKFSLVNFELIASSEEYAEQFNTIFFTKVFGELCKKAIFLPA